METSPHCKGIPLSRGLKRRTSGKYLVVLILKQNAVDKDEKLR
jgi:hypothetical protein